MMIDLFPSHETARLRLRCVNSGDAASTAALMTPGVSRWVASWPMPFTHDMAAARIELVRREALAGDALPFAIISRSSEELIGWATVKRESDDRRGSLGYWLGEEHHRHGYMREVAPAILSIGFDLLDLDVMEAAAQMENSGSFAIMASCGMRPTREVEIYAPARDRYELCRVYEIARPQLHDV